ncbi:MAG TPA: hypothetical protein VN213_06405, partial [Solirubrobacteraceae bacterium]|nr:hypothetical protein [Solirubrobacteraceae bacterium]
MVALRAAVFAIDAFYASVVERAPEVRVKAQNRHSRVFQSLKRAFEIPGRDHQGIHRVVKQVSASGIRSCLLPRPSL